MYCTCLQNVHVVCVIINIIQSLYVYIAPTPNIFLTPNYLQQGVVGEPHDIVCSTVLNSTFPASSVHLTWNFTSNDTRVRVTPTTITTDNSVGIIYTTVIHFDYLIEIDERNYTCLLAFKIYSAESTLYLETISKDIVTSYIVNQLFIVICVHVQKC